MSSLRSKHPILAVANCVLAALGVVAVQSLYVGLTSRSIHDNTGSERVALADADHPTLAVLVIVAGALTVALLIAAAIGLWRRSPSGRWLSYAWIALVLAEQVFFVATWNGGYGMTYGTAYLFPAVTLYAITTAVVLVGSHRRAAAVATN